MNGEKSKKLRVKELDAPISVGISKEPASSKNKRQRIYINKSKRGSSARAVNDARLIKDFNPSDVKFIKISA